MRKGRCFEASEPCEKGKYTLYADERQRQHRIRVLEILLNDAKALSMWPRSRPFPKLY